MIQIIKRQLIGIWRLSLPLIALYFLFPAFLFSFSGIVLCSLAIGLYVAYLTLNSTRNMSAGLKFSPTGVYKDMFTEDAILCGFRPIDVRLRYAYADDGIGMCMFNTIVVDPMVWLGVDDDPQVIEVKKIIVTQVLPSVQENKKIMHAKIKEIISPEALRFIFRHELGHVFYNYSYKNILLKLIIGAITAATGLTSAMFILKLFNPLAGLLFGIVVAAFVDLFITYLSNWFFKLYQEKKADVFAAKFSSNEEIEAAALFFEQYGEIAREYRDTLGGINLVLPTVILIGYLDGSDRARFLRSLKV